jgi:HAD superfamily hydrolase (TIGR01549 family)
VNLRAVLWDVGGPLDTELISERLIDRDLHRAFADEGHPVTVAHIARASRKAVAAYAQDTYASIAWYAAGGDMNLAEAVMARVRAGSGARLTERGGFELREGLPALLDDLAGAGFRLGLAANQPANVLPRLLAAGIGHHFAGQEVSGHHGWHKPDPRLFLRTCELLAVEPTECVMVGDRIDNDLVPARRLGMRVILFRTGRHRYQRPRSADEVPDFVVRDVAGLRAALTAAGAAVPGTRTARGRR